MEAEATEVQETPLEGVNLDNEVVPLELPTDQQTVITSTIPIIESLTIESRTFTQQLGPIPVEPSQPQPLQTDQAMAPVEQIFYQVPAQLSTVQPQPQQPPRPITEMLGTGSFFFLQVIISFFN